ncbi:MAG: hypothetical protein OEV36_05140 [Myxococcales bacterium]|nr:hypothetical protein [Myxococcales bacterium]
MLSKQYWFAFASLALAVLAAAPASSQRSLTASPTCEELTIMDFLARLDEERSRHKRGLDDQDLRDLSQLRRDVCAPYVGYRVTRQPTVSWSNGRMIVRGYLELNHPNGRLAKSRSGEWFYPSGAKAKSALGQWGYSNGMLARTPSGIWYTRDGKYVEDLDEARAQACAYLGKDLCPLGKADDDLLSVTMMGLLNQAAPPKEAEPKGSGDASKKRD